MCLCLLENEINLPLSFPTIGPVCRKGALAWSHTRGRGVLNMTNNHCRHFTMSSNSAALDQPVRLQYLANWIGIHLKCPQ